MEWTGEMEDLLKCNTFSPLADIFSIIMTHLINPELNSLIQCQISSNEQQIYSNLKHSNMISNGQLKMTSAFS